MRIIAVHLLNDYSGSPKVLMQLLKSWEKNQLETHLFTCGGRKGFLSDIEGVEPHFYWYSFAKSPFLRLLFLVSSQLLLMMRLLLMLQKNDVLYINTVLPFGAGIAGKLKGCRVVYHVHETSIKPLPLKKFLFGIAGWSASEVVYVSQFLAAQEPMKNTTRVIYNVLEADFTRKAAANRNCEKAKPMVLMACSLKAYKGVGEFLALAARNPQLVFELVLNASQADIDDYFQTKLLPENLIIHPTQKDMHPFYGRAGLLLNLSDVNLWVETFGLTILEGMAYGLPAIVPPVGGVKELVDDNNGYRIDSKNIALISEKIHELLGNELLYDSMRQAAIEKSRGFEQSHFESQAMEVVTDFGQNSIFWKLAR